MWDRCTLYDTSRHEGQNPGERAPSLGSCYRTEEAEDDDDDHDDGQRTHGAGCWLLAAGCTSTSVRLPSELPRPAIICVLGVSAKGGLFYVRVMPSAFVASGRSCLRLSL